MKIEPDNVDALYVLSNALIEVGDYSGAVEGLTRASVLRPRSYGIWYNLSVAKGYSGDFSGALNSINMALSLRPNDTNALLIRGWVKMYLKDFESAINDLNAVIEKERRVGPSIIWRLVCRVALGDIDAAEADFNNILRDYDANQNNGTYWAFRAIAAYVLGKTDDYETSTQRSADLKKKAPRDYAQIQFFVDFWDEHTKATAPLDP